MDQNTKDILEIVNFIKERMLTKDDVRDIIRNEVPQIMREETRDIRAELTSIRHDLEALTGKVDNLIGLPKEIDHALERIAAIEKHLGINRRSLLSCHRSGASPMAYKSGTMQFQAEFWPLLPVH